MNFKNILNENLDNMMNAIKGMQDSNLSNNPVIKSQPKQNNNNPQNMSPKAITPSLKVSFDSNTNQYTVTDGTGKVIASVNDKNNFAAVIDALTSHVNNP